MKRLSLFGFLILATLTVQAPPSLSFFGASSSGNTLATGLIAYWKFEEANHGPYLDATGNGWTLTDSNNLIIANSGLIGSSVDDHLDSGFAAILGSSASIDTRANTTPFSMSLWVRPAGNVNTVYVVLMTRPAASDWWIQEVNSTGGTTGTLNYYNFNAINAGGTTITTSAVGPGSNGASFDHLVIVFDGVKISIVLNNGTPAIQNTATVKRDGFPIDFFNYSGANTLPWFGRIDEVAFYNRALTASEITQLYNSGSGQRPPGI